MPTFLCLLHIYAQKLNLNKMTHQRHSNTAINKNSHNKQAVLVNTKWFIIIIQNKTHFTTKLCKYIYNIYNRLKNIIIID